MRMTLKEMVNGVIFLVQVWIIGTIALVIFVAPIAGLLAFLK